MFAACSNATRTAVLRAAMPMAQRQTMVTTRASALSYDTAGCLWTAFPRTAINANLRARYAEDLLPRVAALADLEEWVHVVVSALRRFSGDDACSHLRVAKCNALSEEALCGCTEAAAGVAQQLQDPISQVRGTALEAVMTLTDVGSGPVVEAVAHTVRQLDSGCRWRSSEYSIALRNLEAHGW